MSWFDKRLSHRRPQTRTEKFVAALPPGPLIEQIKEIHEILSWLAKDHDDEGGALLAAETRLVEIARTTKTEPYQMRKKRGDGIRRGDN